MNKYLVRNFKWRENLGKGACLILQTGILAGAKGSPSVARGS